MWYPLSHYFHMLFLLLFIQTQFLSARFAAHGCRIYIALCDLIPPLLTGSFPYFMLSTVSTYKWFIYIIALKQCPISIVIELSYIGFDIDQRAIAFPANWVSGFQFSFLPPFGFNFNSTLFVAFHIIFPNPASGHPWPCLAFHADR